MLSITNCALCGQMKDCDHREDYKEELEMLLTISNRLVLSNVEVKCQYSKEERSV